MNPETEANSNRCDSLDSCRIFQKSQLQVFRPSSSSSSSSTPIKFPDFNQKYLKKLSGLSDVLCMAGQASTVHAVVRKDNNAVVYIQYDMFAGKVVREKRIPVTLASFLGQNLHSLALYPIDSVSIPSSIPPSSTTTATSTSESIVGSAPTPLLTDGNATLVPLLEIAGSSHLKDPHWKQLFPLKCFVNYSVRVRDPNDPAHVPAKLHNISVLVAKIQPLVASVLRYDLRRVAKLLRQLDAESTSLVVSAPGAGGASGQQQVVNFKRIKRVLAERIDGNRNVIHAAVFACAPTSNKPIDTDSRTESYQSKIFFYKS